MAESRGVSLPGPRRRLLTRPLFWAALALLLVLAMALDTKFVPDGSPLAQQEQGFDAAGYGQQAFPKVRDYVAQHAVDAGTLAAALAADAAAAARQYGRQVGQQKYVLPVRVTGVVGKIAVIGFTPLEATGVEGTAVAVQLGPAINGTDLRDVTGTVSLNDFATQIEYQDAGSAINNELKQYLKGIGATQLEGKHVTVLGAFTLQQPGKWEITPSQIDVEP